MSHEVNLLDELATNPELLLTVMQPPIAFNPVLVDITRSLTAGLLLSVAIEDAGHGDWTEFDACKIHQQSRLTQGELKGARSRLRELGLLHERRFGFPARAQYRIDFDRLKSALVELARNAPSKPSHGLPSGLVHVPTDSAMTALH